MKNPVDPGELRDVLVYQVPVKTRDRTGATRTTWEDRFEVRAKVDPLNGRDTFYARQAQSTATHAVTCRWRPEITTAGRFLFKNTARFVDIEFVADLENRHAWIVARCVEKVD